MAVIYLDSIDAPELDLFCRLTERQLRNKLEPEKGIYLAESLKVISLALRQGATPKALLMEEKWLTRLSEEIAALPPEVPVYVLPPEQIEHITGYNVTRGALMACARPTPRDAAELLEHATKVVVLEDITDTTNVGAAFRSAAALGADAVLLSHATADPLTRRALRVSMGTVLQLPWAYVHEDWPTSVIDLLAQHGFTSYALALDERARSLNDPVLKQHERKALFMGTEGEGLFLGTINACDYTVTIPMFNGVDSLNVAAASAVACWELFKD